MEACGAPEAKRLGIIVVHWGNSDYLKYCLHQARYFNPRSPIYLLGDTSNNRYPVAAHYDAARYSHEADAFEVCYVHLNSLPYDYVIRWFKRWFTIRQFLLQERPDIESFVCLDSDVLLFCELAREFRHYTGCQLTLSRESGPQYAFFRDHATLQVFCQHLTSLYTEREGLNQLHALYESRRRQPGGIDDMTAFFLYRQAHPDMVGDTSAITDDGLFDHNINLGDGFEYDARRAIKRLSWRDGLPYGRHLATDRLIRFKALHFQGPAKTHIHRCYSAGGLWPQRLYSELYYSLRVPVSRALGRSRRRADK